MLVKMFGKLWRIIGTDEATGEPIYEPVETPAPAPAPMPIEHQRLSHKVNAPTPVVEAPIAPEPEPIPKGTSKKFKRADVQKVVEKQVILGKEINVTAKRDAGPKRRPDGSHLPSETDAPEYDQPAEYDPGAAEVVEGAMAGEFALEGGGLGQRRTQGVPELSCGEPSYVERFPGIIEKLTGYDGTTGEGIYTTATPEEIEDAQRRDVILRPVGSGLAAPPSRTGNYGFAGGTGKGGRVCETERYPLDFRRYGITARPGAGFVPPMSPAQIASFRKDVKAIDAELTNSERRLGSDLTDEGEQID